IHVRRAGTGREARHAGLRGIAEDERAVPERAARVRRLRVEGGEAERPASAGPLPPAESATGAATDAAAVSRTSPDARLPSTTEASRPRRVEKRGRGSLTDWSITRRAGGLSVSGGAR